MKTYCKITVMLSFLLLAGLVLTAQKAAFEAGGYSGLEPKDGSTYLNAMHYDAKSGFLYNISHDDSMVYIDLILSDRAAVQKTMAYGLTTWIDPAGKKKKSLGIVFPVPGDPRDMGPGTAPHGKDMKGMREAAMKQKSSRMLLTGFSGKGSEAEVNPQTDPNFSGRLEGLEEGKVRVFLAIRTEQLGLPEAGLFSVGFETGYMDLNKTGMVAGGSPQGGGDYHGGGPGGGPPGGGMDRTGGQQQQGDNRQAQPDLNELANPSKLWIGKVQLSTGR